MRGYFALSWWVLLIFLVSSVEAAPVPGPAQRHDGPFSVQAEHVAAPFRDAPGRNGSVQMRARSQGAVP